MVVQFQPTMSSVAKNEIGFVGEPFLETLVVEYGPLQLLGRFFAAAAAELRNKGLHLRLGTLENVNGIHSTHKASWPSYPPMLDPTVTGVRENKSYSLICQSDDGQIGAVMAGRIYEGNRTLRDVVENQHFISEPDFEIKTPHRFYVDGHEIAAIRSPFSYIGALWVNPTHRGQDLARLLPALTRAYALARWNIRYDVGLANDEMMKIGMASVYGYSNTDCKFRASGLGDTHDVTGRLLWIEREEIEQNLRHLLTYRFSQVEGRAVHGSADQHVGRI